MTSGSVGRRTLHLVRHGPPLIDRTRAAHEWPLDPAYADDVHSLRGRLPASAVWCSSPEPKATGTAQLLTEAPVRVVDDLREHERLSTDWAIDFAAVVHRAFDQPDLAAYAGWEPLAHTRTRVVAAARQILGEHPGRDIVLVGHGTAWTLLRAAIRDEDPDLTWWSGLAMPDLASFEGPDDMLTP